MSNIFCSQCGSKHSAGSRFCSACGAALSSFSAPRQQLSQPQVEIEDDSSSFVRPRRLSYEIEQGGNNTFKGEELFKSAPVSDSDRLERPVAQTRKLSQEEYLAQSLKECAPRAMQDIDES